MKALLIFLLPGIMLIGCGKMNTNQDSADSILTQMQNNGSLDEQDVANLNQDLLNEPVQMAQTSSNSVMLKLGGAELLIDFIEDLKGDPQETAMIINGIEVVSSIVANPQSLQALIASLVTSQLEGVNILGIPAKDLVTVGLKLIKGDSGKADFSNLFGTLVKGVFNNFLSQSPLGDLFGQITPILDNLGGQQPQNNTGNNNNNNNNNNQGGGLLGSIINTVGGTLAGGNPLLGGLLSLITNLIK